MSLVSELSQLPPSGFVMCTTKEKLKEKNFWITPGSEVLFALTQPLPLKRVHGGHLHLANLSVIFSWQVSGQLTPLTAISEVGSQTALPRIHSENLSKWIKAFLIFAFS